MSNTRIFAWGWVVSGMIRTVLDWLGLGPEPGLISMVKGVLLGLTFGIVAIAVFGDRQPAHPTAREGE